MKEASFDFGKKPPVDGYTKVTEKSVYTKEKGFGLSEVAEADERKIGEKELNRDFLFMGGSHLSWMLKTANILYAFLRATMLTKAML